MSNKKNNEKTTAQKTEVRKETSMRFVGGRVSKKQAKLYLANMPKDGTQQRSVSKLYLGLSNREPGPATGGGAFGSKKKAA